MSRLSTRPKRAAFTLIELLVVVSIIALLVAILIPSLTMSRELARRAVCASNQHQIGLGLWLYANDNNGNLPEGRSTPVTQVWLRPTIEAIAEAMGTFSEEEPMFGPYGVNLTARFGSQFVCPSSKKEPRPIYGYPRWYHGPPRAVTSYTLVTLGTGYSNNPSIWAVEPRQKTIQTDSIIDPSKPLADFILSDVIWWRFAYWLEYTSSYWGANHTRQFITPDDSGDPVSVDAGANNLGLDGHVEWRDSADLEVLWTDPSGEEYWH